MNIAKVSVHAIQYISVDIWGKCIESNPNPAKSLKYMCPSLDLDIPTHSS